MKCLNSRLAVVCSLALLLGATQAALGVNVWPIITRPANDDCSDAKPVGNVTNLAFDTTRATFDGPGYYMTSPNIWYCYTATCTGTATISLLDSSFDTKLAVYRGCECYPPANKLIKTNDDFHGQESELCIPVQAGQQYLIEVGGFNPSVMGQGLLTITCDGQAVPPANDNCTQAQNVGNVTDLPFDTTCATFDGAGYCTNSPNLWYRYTAMSTGNVTVSLLGSQFDTKLAIYMGGACYPKESDLIECNDDLAGTLASQITFQAFVGQTYLIEIGGYNSDASGQGVLTISSDSPVPPPSDDNDHCANAHQIGDVENEIFDTRDATFDGPGHCMESPNIWYCYTASCTGDVTVSLLGSSYDTMLAVYDGCECYPKAGDLIACNDDYPPFTESQVTFAAIAGHQYLIEVGGYSGHTYPSTGRGRLSISCVGEPGPVSKDDCANAKPIGDVTDLPFDTDGATFDGAGHCMRSPNIWYCYTASCTGNVTVALSGTSYDTMLAAYDGCECYPASDKLIECNDDFGGSTDSQITFAVIAGNQYLIEVGGYASETGQGLLTVSCEGVVTPETPDLGDAPDSSNNVGVIMTAYPAGGPMGVKANYPTVHLSGTGIGPYGPAHLNAQIVAYLGKKITRETEADIGFDQDGVNKTDSPDMDQGDDGVVVPLNMPSCRWTTFDYKVNVVDPNVDLYVN
ncbi:MAG: hypothetical protein ACYS74_18920, partial [Planctomycetota bacterium]